MVLVGCGCRKMDDNTGVNAAILERLEKVVQSLQENSVKVGELLAVHNEKLDSKIVLMQYYLRRLSKYNRI